MIDLIKQGGIKAKPTTFNFIYLDSKTIKL